MVLTPISYNAEKYPAELRPILDRVKLYDSICSPEAWVILIGKDGRFFLKSAPKASLEQETNHRTTLFKGWFERLHL